MRKFILAAVLAASLGGCASTGSQPPASPSGPVDPGTGITPRQPSELVASVLAPLDRTVVDEQGLTAAYASFDLLLTAIDGLRDVGVLEPGSPRALKIQALIEVARDGLNTARAVHRGLSTRDPAVALDAATGAFRQIAVLLKEK